MKEWLATFCLIVANSGFVLTSFSSSSEIWGLSYVRIYPGFTFTFEILSWHTWSCWGGFNFPHSSSHSAVLCILDRKVLMTHQCFGYGWAVFAQHQDHATLPASTYTEEESGTSGLMGSLCPDEVSPPHWISVLPFTVWKFRVCKLGKFSEFFGILMSLPESLFALYFLVFWQSGHYKRLFLQRICFINFQSL